MGVDKSSTASHGQPASDVGSTPRLILLPLAILAGAVIGIGTLDIHQQADHPHSHQSSRSAGAHVSWQEYEVHSALRYLGQLTQRLHP